MTEMLDMATPNLDVSIIPPDKSLLAKIGVAKLDEVFTPAAVSAAQTVITDTAGEFAAESLIDLEMLETAFQTLLETHDGSPVVLNPVIDTAFSIKSKSGLAGYDLVSSLAKSLYLYCEARNHQPIVSKTREVIEWHITTIRQILKMNIKGSGGAMGEAISAELMKLAARAA